MNFTGDPTCSHSVNSYFTIGAYNACGLATGTTIYVDVNALTDIIGVGIRVLHFQIFSQNSNPVVAVVNDTGVNHYQNGNNFVLFQDVMNLLVLQAFTSTSAPNATDPLFLIMDIRSDNLPMFVQLAAIFEAITPNTLLGPQYSFESMGTNFANTTLMSALAGKIVIVIDKTSNGSSVQCPQLAEYVNFCIAGGTPITRSYAYSELVNVPDMSELQEFGCTGLTMVLPDAGSTTNPNPYVVQEAGCQFMMCNFSNYDTNLQVALENMNTTGYAFTYMDLSCNTNTTLPDPDPQNPALSYAPKETTADYYNFTL